MTSLVTLDENFGHFLPFILVISAIVFLMLAKIARMGKSAFWVTMVLLAGAWLSVDTLGVKQELMGFLPDSLGFLGIKILLPAVMLICFMLNGTPRKIESLLLILISTFGAMVTLIGQNWMLLFMGIQCMSLPIYGLLAFDPENRASLSSSARYLLLSFVAMAIMLFGILLLYAATGSMDIAMESEKIKALLPDVSGLVGLSLMLIFIGLAFKVSLFPFHAWAPEVYQGARLFVLSYLLVVMKSVVVIFIMRMAFFLKIASLSNIIAIMAILSMWVGSGMMLKETKFIRLLAFLSISHLGALMIPILAHNSLSLEAIYLDIIAFGLALFLIFFVIKKLDLPKDFSLKDVQGLYYKNPQAALVLAIALISITGFPLTAGFVGKFAIFQSGFAASLWYLMIHFVLSSILSLLVIMKIIAGFWHEGFGFEKILQKRDIMLFCASLIIVAVGIFPEPLISLVKTSLNP